MGDYVNYLKKVWAELNKLPPEEFNQKMNEISHPSIHEFISAPISFSDEPIVYCEPTPRAFMMLAKTCDG